MKLFDFSSRSYETRPIKSNKGIVVIVVIKLLQLNNYPYTLQIHCDTSTLL